MTFLILFLIIFLLMGFFNGAEMAFLSCNKLRLRHLADSGKRSAMVIDRFQKDQDLFLMTILTGTNLAHVAVASLFAYAMGTYFDIQTEWVITLLLTPWIIIFAENVPKVWFRQKANDFIYRFAWILEIFDRFFFPITRAIQALIHVLVIFMPPIVKRSPFVTKDEFRYMVDESARKGVLHEHEKRLIHTILNLGVVNVQEVMIPLKTFPVLEFTKKTGDAKEAARRSKKQIILIYEEIPSIVIGIVYVFDLLFDNDDNLPLRQFLRAPLFIPHTLSAEKAILLLQRKHASYAVVTNARQEVIGVVGVDNLIRF